MVKFRHIHAFSVIGPMLFFVVCGVSAQEIDLTARERAHLGFKAEASSKRTSEDQNTHFQESDRALFGSIPLYSRFDMEAWAKYWRITVDPAISKKQIKTNIFNETIDLDFYNMDLSSVALSRGRESYLVRAGIRVQQEEGQSAYGTAQFFSLGTSHFNKDTIGLYGLYFGDAVYGKNIWLPILGLKTQFNDEWALTGVLPLSLRLSYKASPALMFTAYFKPDGAAYRIQNNNQFSGRDGSLDFRIQRIKSGLEVFYKLDEYWGIKPEVGFLTRQKVSIADSGDKFREDEFEGGLFINVTLDYRFGVEPKLDEGLQ